jgi:glutamyl-tRNA synthetase
MSVRVRYAPSPTGKQHIGGIRTALYDYFAAKATGGKFILRIEDTDQSRSTAGSIQNIYDTFAWLGVHWDEGPDVGGPLGPYVQSERFELYKKHAQRLVDSGHAYRCYCTSERLETVRNGQTKKKLPLIGYDRHCRDLTAEQRVEYEKQGKPSVIRLKIPLEGTTVFHDELLGDMEKANTDINPDPILIKSDGFPTYHLANVVDDHLMEITHVLRSQEWLSSGPIHMILYQAFGWKPPQFYHPPMVMGKDGHKLSKRHGDTSVDEFRDKGYLPEAILNYITLLGWSYDDSREFFTREELEKLFTLDKLSKSSTVFDYKKLDWFNGMYIRKLKSAELCQRLIPFMQRAGILSSPVTETERQKLMEIIPLIRERLTTLSECVPWTIFFFRETVIADAAEFIPKKSNPDEAKNILKTLKELLPNILDKPETEIENELRQTAERLDIKLGSLLMPLRMALTGSKVSPPLVGSIRIIGLDIVMKRLEAAIVLLSKNG